MDKPPIAKVLLKSTVQIRAIASKAEVIVTLISLVYSVALSRPLTESISLRLYLLMLPLRNPWIAYLN
jgi:hypothetical protein